jgi:hypothetical protein
VVDADSEGDDALVCVIPAGPAGAVSHAARDEAADAGVSRRKVHSSERPEAVAEHERANRVFDELLDHAAPSWPLAPAVSAVV